MRSVKVRSAIERTGPGAERKVVKGKTESTSSLSPESKETAVGAGQGKKGREKDGGASQHGTMQGDETTTAGCREPELFTSSARRVGNTSDLIALAKFKLARLTGVRTFRLR